MPASGKPLKLPGAATMVWIETVRLLAVDRPQQAALGVWPRDIPRPLQTPADWETSCSFRSFEGGFSPPPPASPSVVPRCYAADWVRTAVCGLDQCLPRKPGLHSAPIQLTLSFGPGGNSDQHPRIGSCMLAGLCMAKTGRFLSMEHGRGTG